MGDVAFGIIGVMVFCVISGCRLKSQNAGVNGGNERFCVPAIVGVGRKAYLCVEQVEAF